MARKKRNYKLEYARRKARAAARGLSRSQARGHPKPHEKSIRQRNSNSRYERVLEKGVRALREGKSLSAAAKAIHVSPERLRDYAVKTGVVAKKGTRWTVSADQRVRVLPLLTNGELKTIRVQGYTRSRTLGAYWNAVGQFAQTNNRRHLAEWEGRSITDTSGHRYPFETKPNVLYRLTSDYEEPFEDIYRIVV